MSAAPAGGRRTLAVVAACASSAFASGAAPPPPRPVEIAVYAAASLQDALREIAPAWERALGGVRLVFNYAGSNDLARQILAANKADVFLSADEDWMDRVARAGLVDEGSRRTILSNRLVVVARPDAGIPVRSAADLARPSAGRIALADPDAVPAGKYAKAWLEGAGVWSAVRHRVVPALDVRAALAAVESGAVRLGIVYRTDAAISRRVEILHEVPEREAPPVSYVVAALARRPHLDASRRAARWLAGPEASAAFARWGFVVRSADGTPIPLDLLPRAADPPRARRSAAGGRRGFAR